MDSKTDKVPMPPTKTKLFKSISFWSTILVTLDKKVQALSEKRCYGTIGLHIKIHSGRIVQVVWKDEVYANELVDKAGGTNPVIEKELKPEASKGS